MEVDYSEQAMADIAFWKKSGNQPIHKKISRLISAIQINPYEGIGKPEALKYELSGKWFRRVTDEHRIVYEIIDNRIRIHSARGHYWK